MDIIKMFFRFAKFYKAIAGLIVLALCPYISRSQISEHIYQLLPDSLKPADRNRLSQLEKRNLLHYGTFCLSEVQSDSLLPLANALEQENATEPDVHVRLLNLNAIFSYYFNSQSLSPYALKYADKLLDQLDTSKRRQELYWETMASKGYLLVAKGNYEDGINILVTALEHYKSVGDSLGITDLSVYLAHAYFDMDLFQETIEHALTARKYLMHNKFYQQSILQLNVELGIYYLSLCKLDTSGVACARSEELLQGVLKDPGSATWKAYCYSNIAWKRYRERQYIQSSLYADSALNPRLVENDPYPLLTLNTAMTYKGLSLVEMGQTKEGVSFLKKVVQAYDSCPGCIGNVKSYMDATYKLYEVAERNGLWSEALLYYKKFEKTRDLVNITGNRGEILVAKRKYDVTLRDTRIKKLEFEQKLNEEREGRTLLIVVVMALALLIVILLFYNRQRKNKIRELEAGKAIQEEKRLHNEALIRLEHNMVRMQQDAVLAQRKKISEDMHDDLSSSLAGLRFYIADIKAGSSSEQVKTAMADVEEEVTAIYQNARQYMHSLNQNIQLQYDLAGYLKELKSKMAEAVSLFLDVQFDEAAIKIRLSADQHYHLYHIIREAIANIVKHASASRAFVHVDIQEDSCNFLIGDNGKGFSPSPVTELSPGMGLQNVIKRMTDMGGQIETRSDSKGTIISGSFPLYQGLQHG